jgi:hypothetical protein
VGFPDPLSGTPNMPNRRKAEKTIFAQGVSGTL